MDVAAAAGRRWSPGSTTAIVPPCSCTTQRAMARPSPVPPPAGRSPRVNRSKTRSRSAGGMPWPSSVTSSSRWSPCRSARPAPCRRAGCAGPRCPAGSRTPGAAAPGRRARQRPAPDASEAHVAAGAGRVDPASRDHLVEEVRPRRSARRSGTTPASSRDRSSSSVTSRPSRSVWVSAVCSVAGSGSATPSTMFSSTPCSAVIGVRSSCETLAISSRRCRSAACQVRGHLVERLGQLADLVAGGGPHPTGVVAAGHRPGRRGHLAQRRGHAVGEHLRGDKRDAATAISRVPAGANRCQTRSSRWPRPRRRPAGCRASS